MWLGLLFAEQMLERHKELHIVLPFNKEDFYATSVDFGLAEMSAWRQRCDRVLAQAREVHYSTTEAFLGDNALRVCQHLYPGPRPHPRGAAGRAALCPGRARSCDDTALRWDSRFRYTWTTSGSPVHEIDLAALRAQLSRPLTAWGPTASAPAAWSRVGHLKRQVRAMLFSDVKNFSHLSDTQLPVFIVTFFDEVADMIASSPRPLAFRNTWGDGLFLVFDRVVECAGFALRLLDRMGQVPWEAMGLPRIRPSGWGSTPDRSIGIWIRLLTALISSGATSTGRRGSSP